MKPPAMVLTIAQYNVAAENTRTHRNSYQDGTSKYYHGFQTSVESSPSKVLARLFH